VRAPFGHGVGWHGSQLSPATAATGANGPTPVACWPKDSAEGVANGRLKTDVTEVGPGLRPANQRVRDITWATANM